MLSVVDQLAGVAIGKGRGPSAEARLRFDDEHACAVADAARRRAQPGKAAADDDDVYVHSHCLSAMSACCGRATRARAVKTS